MANEAIRRGAGPGSVCKEARASYSPALVRGQDTDLRILSDGEEGLRGVVGTWFGKKCQHRPGLGIFTTRKV
jgi:hypothetical protein